MKITGSVEIRVIDSRTRELKQTIKQNNLIPNNTLQAILDWNGSAGFVSGSSFGSNNVPRISISTSTVEPSIFNSTLNNIIATGYVPTGVVSPTYNSLATPPFGQIQNRIDFNNTERIFNSLGLTILNPSNNQNTSSTAITHLKLDTPCTQGAFDFLDIFYRIQFFNTEGQGLPFTALVDFGGAMFGARNFYMSDLYTSVCNAPTVSYANLNPADFLASYRAFRNGGNDRTNDIIGWTSGTKITSHYKYKYIYSKGLEEEVGRIFNSMLQGLNSTSNAMYSNRPIADTVKPIQNLFSHSASATRPFFDSLALASGNGKVLPSGNWTNKLPEFYRITIVGSGAVGTATYKYSVRKHLGFNGNTYTDRAVANPFRNPNLSAASGMHGWRDENNDVLRYSDNKIVQYDDTGVTLLDIMDGAYQNWDASTTPTLAATQIRQCATDGSKIYVGCRQTGLWIIDVVANIVTRPFTNPCYGVDVGRNSVAYALIDGGLYRSSDWSTPLAFTYTGITDNNWSKVYFLKVDPEHIDDRLCFVIQPATATNRRIVWFNRATGVATTGAESSNLKPWAASLDVSDTGSHWVSGAGRLTFAATSLGSLGGTLSAQTFTSSIYGSDSYYKISFYKNFLICQDRIVDNAGATINSYSGLTGRAFLLHLAGGIVLTNREMRQLFTDNSYCWDNYGWNGNNWELNNGGAKITHADEQLLANGINIQFQNGSSAPHFQAADFYTVGVCNGLWKDNATTLYYESAWYSKPAQFKVLLPNNFTIPAVAPYELKIPQSLQPGFVTTEIDSPELNSFKINGQPIATLYTTGTVPPAPNEIRLRADGTMIFNASDANKVVSGYFAYVKD